LLALDQMGLKWHTNDLTCNLKRKLLLSVEDNVNGFNSQNIANTLLALDQMGLKWHTNDLTIVEKIRKENSHKRDLAKDCDVDS